MVRREYERGWGRIEDVRALRATTEALLVDVDGEEIWIPQSQIHEDSEVYEEDTEGGLIISAWIAEKKGLEGKEYVP